jgi:alpha-tubulin suppressor-like RCC1 family protein
MDDDSVAAITTTGDLYTWGRNQYGQIGNGKSGTDEVQATPIKVLSNVASVAMSKCTVAAVATNGDLYT